MTKIFLKTFGCRVNQVESQSIREKFAALGVQFTDRCEEADICLLNTCTVTENADADAEKLIRQILTRAPKARLVLTGCYVSAQSEKIKTKFPAAEIIEKHKLASELFNDEEFFWTVKGHEGHSRAFVKIQDGCDSFCSYCIVPFARPVKSSKPLSAAVEEIKSILKNGFKEIVLTGINIGNYLCPETGAKLDQLLTEIFKIRGNFRVRLSSIELNTVTPELLSAAKAGGKKFCEHFHVPLQSGCDVILRDMNRHYSAQDYKNKVAEIRKYFPDAGIFADVIAGYPTEKIIHFEETYDLARDCRLAGLHVFSFSLRPGTKAAALEHMPAGVIKKRAEILRVLDKKLRENFASAQIGKTLNVLAEDGGECVAANFARVKLNKILPPGTLAKVKITGAKDGICHGELL